MDVPCRFTTSAPGVPQWSPLASMMPAQPELPCCIRVVPAAAGASVKARKAERKPDDGALPMPQLMFRNVAALLYQNMLRKAHLMPAFRLKFPTPGPDLDSEEEEEGGEEEDEEPSGEELESLEEEGMAREREGA